ncbi:MAG: RagB/SusD family nutrient uptake outer membrane protein [Bacteroidota bacterium]
MIKFNKYTLFILLLAVFAVACEERLDEQPQQALSTGSVYSSTQDLETALAGAYNAAQHSDFMGCNTTMVPDIIADNGAWRGSFTSMIDVSGHAVTADNGEVRGLWSMGFRTINNANLILQFIPEVTDAEIAEAGPRLRGESLFLRGMAYFEMVRFFGKPWSGSSTSDLGVPIIATGTSSSGDVSFPARATVAEVYAQAISDFTEAASLLPDAIGTGRANRFAALAYLAEIAFQQRDYAAAANFADQVIAGPFELNPTPGDYFTSEGSVESIFDIAHTAQDNPGVNGSLPTFHAVGGRGGDVLVSEFLKDAYNQIVPQRQLDLITADGLTCTDLRVSQLTINDTVNIEKYEGFVNNDDDAPIFRLAEILLMRAEALARTSGINAESVDLLNQVRDRALRVVDGAGVESSASAYVSYAESDFASADDLVEAIILERQVELAWEGNRFHDLNRLSRTVSNDRASSDSGANNLVWPVPQRDLDANSSLVQNPGY